MTKKLLVSALMAQLLTSFALAATGPMNIVEKSSYALTGLVKKKQIDESYLYNVNAIDIQSGSNGYTLTLKAPSADPATLNTLTMVFDKNGKSLSSSADFKSASQNKVFTAIDAATIIDLSAEAVVDHLTESQDLVEVSEKAVSVSYVPDNGGVSVHIQLSDSRTFTIKMDDTGTVLSKGF